MPVLVNSSVDGSEGLGDYLRFNVSQTAPASVDLGPDPDAVEVFSNAGVQQVRLTFTSAQAGNGSPLDSNTMANQDGGLAVRMQAEDGTGALTGVVHRFDDEGISFLSTSAIRFDVRDLVSGVARGDQFQVVRLGTSAVDLFSEGSSLRNTYINAGMGNDLVSTGSGNDFLVGGAGDDRLSGNQGNDSFIGGAGNDIIFGGAGDDNAIVNVSTDGADQVALGGGNDRVTVSGAMGVTQFRLTFTSAEVGNNNSNDSNTLANQDGGLAVRLQAEDGAARSPARRSLRRRADHLHRGGRHELRRPRPGERRVARRLLPGRGARLRRSRRDRLFGPGGDLLRQRWHGQRRDSPPSFGDSAAAAAV